MPENKQLDLNRTASSKAKIIKFCYILSVILLLGCGNEKSKEKVKESTSETEQETSVSEANQTKTILCFGDSITAGYGLDDSNEAFPALLQNKIDSLGLDYNVINSGVSGETTAGGLSRIDWVLKQDIAVFLLELGGNDGLRGVPLTETRSNLQAIMDAVREKDPETTIILAGMELPPNMGNEYTTEFRLVFSELAEKNDVLFIPFILKDVGGIPELNQGDGIHPTAEGHQIVASTVWEVLKSVITP